MERAFHFIQYEQQEPDSLLALLTEQQKQELGPIEPDWFEQISIDDEQAQHAEQNTPQKEEDKTTEDGYRDKMTEDADGDKTTADGDGDKTTEDGDKTITSILEFPSILHGDFPSPALSPSPFSPNKARQQRHHKHFDDDSILGTPAAAGAAAGGGMGDPLMTPAGQILPHDPTCLMRYLHKSPANVYNHGGLAGYTPQGLATPRGIVSASWTSSLATPAASRDLISALGVEQPANASWTSSLATPAARGFIGALGIEQPANVSWTSSMATPAAARGLSTIKKMEKEEMSPQYTGPVVPKKEEEEGAARALFSPGSQCSNSQLAYSLDTTGEEEEEEEKNPVNPMHQGIEADHSHDGQWLFLEVNKKETDEQEKLNQCFKNERDIITTDKELEFQGKQGDETDAADLIEQTSSGINRRSSRHHARGKRRERQKEGIKESFNRLQELKCKSTLQELDDKSQSDDFDSLVEEEVESMLANKSRHLSAVMNKTGKEPTATSSATTLSTSQKDQSKQGNKSHSQAKTNNEKTEEESLGTPVNTKSRACRSAPRFEASPGLEDALSIFNTPPATSTVRRQINRRPPKRKSSQQPLKLSPLLSPILPPVEKKEDISHMSRRKLSKEVENSPLLFPVLVNTPNAPNSDKTCDITSKSDPHNSSTPNGPRRSSKRKLSQRSGGSPSKSINSSPNCDNKDKLTVTHITSTSSPSTTSNSFGPRRSSKRKLSQRSVTSPSCSVSSPLNCDNKETGADVTQPMSTSSPSHKHTLNIPQSCDTTCISPEVSSSKKRRVADSPAADLFTQVSPSALSAMYNSAAVSMDMEEVAVSCRSSKKMRSTQLTDRFIHDDKEKSHRRKSGKVETKFKSSQESTQLTDRFIQDGKEASPIGKSGHVQTKSQRGEQSVGIDNNEKKDQTTVADVEEAQKHNSMKPKSCLSHASTSTKHNAAVVENMESIRVGYTKDAAAAVALPDDTIEFSQLSQSAIHAMMNVSDHASDQGSDVKPKQTLFQSPIPHVTETKLQTPIRWQAETKTAQVNTATTVPTEPIKKPFSGTNASDIKPNENLFQSPIPLVTETKTPIRWKAETKTAQANTVDLTTEITELPKKPFAGTNAPVRKPLSLKNRKSKGFFYPTTNQIAETCPKKLFNMTGASHTVQTDVMGKKEEEGTSTSKELFEVVPMKPCTLDKPTAPIIKAHKTSGFTTLTSYNEAVEKQDITSDITSGNTTDKKLTTSHQSTSSIMPPPNIPLHNKQSPCTTSSSSASSYKQSINPAKVKLRSKQSISNLTSSTDGIPGYTSKASTRKDIISHSIKSGEDSSRLTAPSSAVCADDLVTDSQMMEVDDSSWIISQRINPSNLTATSCTQKKRDESGIDTSDITQKNGSLVPGAVSDKSSPLQTSVKATKKEGMQEDIDPYSKFPTAQESEHEKPTTNTIPATVSFVTASKKPIVMSETALTKARQMIQDVDKETQDISHVEMNEELNTKGELQIGAITVSESQKDMIKLHNYVEEDEDISQVQIESKPVADVQESSSFVGFQSASGKHIKLSEKQLKAAKQLISEIDSEVCIDSKGTVKSDAKADEALNKSSKKSVAISKPANTSDVIPSTVTIITDSSSQQDRDNQPVMTGFKLASGSAIEISDAAQRKAAKIMEEVSECAITTTNVQNTSNVNEQMFIGFQSASRKNIDISEKAQKKAAALLEELSEDIEIPGASNTGHTDDQNSTSIGNEQKFVGFQSASGKAVQISESAKKRAEALIKAMRESEPSQSVETSADLNAQMFSGFQSASGKNVVFSEAALDKAKSLVEEDQTMEQSDDMINTFPIKSRPLTQVQAVVKKPKGYLPFKAPRMAAKQNVSTSKDACVDRISTEPADSHKQKDTSGFTNPNNNTEPIRKTMETASHTSNAMSMRKDDCVDRNSKESADSHKQKYTSGLTNRNNNTERTTPSKTSHNDCSPSKLPPQSSASEVLNDSLDGFSFTQLAEVTEGTAAFMDKEEEFVCTPPPSKPPSSIINPPHTPPSNPPPSIINPSLSPPSLKMGVSGNHKQSVKSDERSEIRKSIPEEEMDTSGDARMITDVSKSTSSENQTMEISSKLPKQYPQETSGFDKPTCSKLETTSGISTPRTKLPLYMTASRKAGYDSQNSQVSDLGNSQLPVFSTKSRKGGSASQINSQVSDLGNSQLPVFSAKCRKGGSASQNNSQVSDLGYSQPPVFSTKCLKGVHVQCSPNKSQVSNLAHSQRSPSESDQLSRQRIRASKKAVRKAQGILASVDPNIDKVHTVKKAKKIELKEALRLAREALKRAKCLLLEQEASEEDEDDNNNNDDVGTHVATDAGTDAGTDVGMLKTAFSQASDALDGVDLDESFSEEKQMSQIQCASHVTDPIDVVDEKDRIQGQEQKSENFEPETSTLNENVLEMDRIQCQGQKSRPIYYEPLTSTTEDNVEPEAKIELETRNVGQQKFVGFQTGSGKPVQISEEALEKAKCMLSEHDIETKGQGHKPKGQGQADNGKEISKAGVVPVQNLSHESSDTAVKRHKPPLKPSTEELTSNLMEIDISGEILLNSEDIIKKRSDPINQGAPPQFMGFATASGKTVHVSEEALEKAQRVLQESESEANLEIPEFSGFQTGTGKTVTVSEEALKKMREIDEQNHTEKADKILDRNKGFAQKMEVESSKGASALKFPGFQTGSGKLVTVSEHALRKAKGLLNEINSTEDEKADSSDFRTDSPPFGLQASSDNAFSEVLEDTTCTKEAKPLLHQENNSTCSKDTPDVQKFAGFQTGSGKTVQVSEAALKLAKQVLQDNDSSYNEDIPTVPQFSGFQTCTGKTVTVSDEALQKVRGALDEQNSSAGKATSDQLVPTPPCSDVQTGSAKSEDKSVHVPVEVLKKTKGLSDDFDTVNDPKQEPEPKFAGFQTCTGKLVKVSEHALQRARGFLDDADSNKETKLEATPKFAGFQTCTGKLVKVSDAALKKAKGLFDETDHEEDQKPETSKFAGFQTGSGKTVKVSDAALQKARGLFDDADSNNEIKMEAPPKFAGFQTCTGKTVKVSDAALKKARGLLDEHEDTEPSTTNLPQPPPFAGFQTGTGRTVNISDEALMKAKGLLADTADKMETATPKFAGFQTCTGKSVSVSENALKKAKHLLEETDEHDKKSDTPKFGGFQTCTGKAVAVSDEALKQARGLLDETRTAGEIVARPPTFAGFQTCTGKSVEVSKDALKHAPGLLDDDVHMADDDIHILHDDVLRGKDEHWNTEPTERTKTEGSHRELQDTVNKPDVSSRRVVTVSQEAVELAEALAEDMEDDDDVWESQPAPAGNAGNEILPSAQISDPDALCWDRQIPGRDLKPVRCAPPTDDEHSTETLFSHPRLNSASSDRKGFHAQSALGTAKKQQQQTSSKQEPSSAMSSFQTPVKNVHAQNKTPSKQQAASTSKGFSTPYKQPPSSFKTPIKAKPKQTEIQDKDEKQKEKELSEAAVAEEPMDQQPSDVTVGDSSEIGKLRLKARVAQAQRIRKKKESNEVKPQAGKLFLQKQHRTDRRTIQQAMRGGYPATFKQQQLHSYGVLPSVLHVTSATAEAWRFCAQDYYASSDKIESVRLGDGAVVVLAEDGTFGKEEMANGFLDMSGVEPGLINKDWLYNHYRWIVWKLAAYEVAFPIQFAGRSLNPDQLMLQLKYRYDREVDHSHRSCLKKIYEQDDTPQKTMVLCVAAITMPGCSTKPAQQGNSSSTKPAQLLLTDGWYSIPGILDRSLTSLVTRGKLRVGDKIMLTGSEMMGGKDPCAPLEAPSDIALRLCYNTVRRARWHSRLGYCMSETPALPLSSLCADGGPAGCVDVVVTRAYPIQYLEKAAAAGVVSVVRCARAEEREARRHEQERQRYTETLYSQLQAQIDKQNHAGMKHAAGVGGRKWISEEIGELHGGAEIYEAYQTAADTHSFQLLLTDRQRESLSTHQQLVQERLHSEIQEQIQTQMADQENMQSKRNVTPLQKFRVAGCHTKDIDRHINCLLTVWRPSGDIETVLQEGARLRIYNLAVSEARRFGSSSGACSISLASTRSTRYSPQPLDDNFLDLIYEPREVMCVRDLLRHYGPPAREVDIVGVVVSVSAAASAAGGDSNSNSSSQAVFIADASMDIMCIKFWGGLQGHGLVLLPGTFISCCNLTGDNRRSSGGIPVLMAGDTAHISCSKPQHKHTRQALEALRAQIKNIQEFVACAQQKLNSSPLPTHHQPTVTPVTMVTTRDHAAHHYQAQSAPSPAPWRSSKKPPPPWILKQSTAVVEENTVSDTGKVTTEKNEEENTADDSKLVSNEHNGNGSSPEMDIEVQTAVNTEEKTVVNTEGTVADPAVERKKAVQSAKVAKLESYISHNSVIIPPSDEMMSSLNTPVPLTVRRGFKPPSRTTTPTAATATAAWQRGGRGRPRGKRGRHSLGATAKAENSKEGDKEIKAKVFVIEKTVDETEPVEEKREDIVERKNCEKEETQEKRDNNINDQRDNNIKNHNNLDNDIKDRQNRLDNNIIDPINHGDSITDHANHGDNNIIDSINHGDSITDHTNHGDNNIIDPINHGDSITDHANHRDNNIEEAEQKVVDVNSVHDRSPLVCNVEDGEEELEEEEMALLHVKNSDCERTTKNGK